MRVDLGFVREPVSVCIDEGRIRAVGVHLVAVREAITVGVGCVWIRSGVEFVGIREVVAIRVNEERVGVKYVDLVPVREPVCVAIGQQRIRRVYVDLVAVAEPVAVGVFGSGISPSVDLFGVGQSVAVAVCKEWV